MFATFLMLQVTRPFAFAAPGLAAAALILGGLAIGFRRAKRLDQPRARAGAVALIQMTLFTLLAIALSYAFTARAGPLWDGSLAQADRAMGLEWPVLRATLDRWPLAVPLLGFSYHSLSLQMVVLICGLSAAGELSRLRLLVCAAILSGFATVFLSAVVPANGNLFDPAQYRYLWPAVPWQQAELLHGLRSGAVRTIDFMKPEGIVTFPSYHATLGLLFARGFRYVPGLRVAGPVWAGLTVLATPIFGGHYMVDVLAGAVLAVIAAACAVRLDTAPTRSLLPSSARRVALQRH
ncbi:phosphatase PAP2 family protein [Sphingomonas sp. ID1715]|uniref:phosphatase PAP2 family protein n=1 Tax=Sphingomonas sp. ID1715 TaxID=1656898 RepID=UPI0017D6EE4C|nr:phosphatase PAP2 family protein [Sphingomonas sp. ID1715]NNM75837.1 phosphatase PAP2 family protein [Sphingomonas sp. ID1715]